MNVNVVCRNPHDDRVIPRFARYLRDMNGWTLTAKPDSKADVVYLSGYFESQMCRPWPRVPVAAYFTHREEQGSAKAKLFDEIAGRVGLRICTAQMYAEYCAGFGPTMQIRAPVERDHFTIPEMRRNSPMVAGFSGYSYRSGRKGEGLAEQLAREKTWVTWKASGRGWPVKTVLYKWDEMPGYYQSLDVLVMTSMIEGVPMPPLEAMSCGVSVVLPSGVGIHDELPEVQGIYLYECGDFGSLSRAFDQAINERDEVDREALRAVTEPYSIENWCERHRVAIAGLVEYGVDGGLEEEEEDVARPIKIEDIPQPVEQGTGSTRGIYVVAFGDPSRNCAKTLMESIKKYMPEIPIALCASKKIGLEDVLIIEEDSDVGGRRAKLRAYELAPAEWESVLYLDADTEVVGDIRFYFELIEDGWEFVICKDPHLMDTMHAFRRKYNGKELEATAEQIYTMHTLQYNGGVWAFAREPRVGRFFARWLAEWEKYAQRDQGALIRAMYTEPLKVYLLGNEWNTFPKYTQGIETAGLMHYPGRARRWQGQIPGRIDSQAAWKMVKRYEKSR